MDYNIAVLYSSFILYLTFVGWRINVQLCPEPFPGYWRNLFHVLLLKSGTQGEHAAAVNIEDVSNVFYFQTDWLLYMFLNLAPL